jgi:hypothetical protein
MCEKRPSHVLSVDAEFRKYASGETSSQDVDILRFWEVRPSDLRDLL